MSLYTPKQLANILGVTTQTLTQWADDGKLQVKKTQGGHRRYVFSAPDISEPSSSAEPKRSFVYARVSSRKQKQDLQRQVDMLKAAYPEFEVIEDVGSGINFRRRGLISLLEHVFAGNVSTVVVAHRDRLTRFGFELFQYIFEKFRVSLRVVSDEDVKEPVTELAKDLLSVITVFSARYYGSRSYALHKENKNIPKPRTNQAFQQMPRRIKVLLQSRSKQNQRNKNIVTRKVASSSDEE